MLMWWQTMFILIVTSVTTGCGNNWMWTKAYWVYSLPRCTVEYLLLYFSQSAYLPCQLVCGHWSQLGLNPWKQVHVRPFLIFGQVDCHPINHSILISVIMEWQSTVHFMISIGIVIGLGSQSVCFVICSQIKMIRSPFSSVRIPQTTVHDALFFACKTNADKKALVSNGLPNSFSLSMMSETQSWG